MSQPPRPLDYAVPGDRRPRRWWPWVVAAVALVFLLLLAFVGLVYLGWLQSRSG